MKSKQQRIVTKVDELMRWCDAPEARLTAAFAFDRAFIRLRLISAFIEFRRDRSAQQEGEL